MTQFGAVFGGGRPVIVMAAVVPGIADGCIVGSALKQDGDTWTSAEPDRAADFMARTRAARRGR